MARGIKPPRGSADDTSSHIPDAAEQLFRKLGYEKTTVADIVSQIAARWLSHLGGELAWVVAVGAPIALPGAA